MAYFCEEELNLRPPSGRKPIAFASLIIYVGLHVACWGVGLDNCTIDCGYVIANKCIAAYRT